MSRYSDAHVAPSRDVHLHDATKAAATPVCGATTGLVVGEVGAGDCEACVALVRG